MILILPIIGYIELVMSTAAKFKHKQDGYFYKNKFFYPLLLDNIMM